MLFSLGSWDRYQDNHIGLVYTGIHLDDVAPTLVQNDVRRQPALVAVRPTAKP